MQNYVPQCVMKSLNYIKKLKQDGHTIYIISGRDNGEYTNPYNMTKNWLEKYDIVYDKLFLVDAYNSHSKTEICLENNVDIMIDDSKRMCTDIKKNGIIAISFWVTYDKLFKNDMNCNVYWIFFCYPKDIYVLNNFKRNCI